MLKKYHSQGTKLIKCRVEKWVTGSKPHRYVIVFTKNVLAKNLTNFDPLSKNFYNRTDLSSSLNTKKTDGTMFGEPIRLSEPLQILSMFLAISQPVPDKHLQWKRGLNVAWDMNFSNSIGKQRYLKIYHLCRDGGRSKNLRAFQFRRPCPFPIRAFILEG